MVKILDGIADCQNAVEWIPHHKDATLWERKPLLFVKW